MKNRHFDRQELAKWMKLTLVKGVGPKRIQQLFSHFETIDELFSAQAEKLLRTGVMTSDMIKSLEQLKGASDEKFAETIDFCYSNKIGIVTLVESSYPKRLLEVGAPPCTLFFWGDTSLLDAPKTFAIVGAREANDAAKTFAYDSAKTLSEAGFVIVSGGAKGIDTKAHEGALDAKGKTIAVMGTGVSNFYPEENSALFETIKEKGLLVSEHLPNFHGDRISFLQRNRITSGLSDGLLFCSSESLSSGTATQVRIAHTQKKPIFCPAIDMGIVPNIGVQDSIVEYEAKQVHNAEEIISALGKAKMVQHSSLQNY